MAEPCLLPPDAADDAQLDAADDLPMLAATDGGAEHPERREAAEGVALHIGSAFGCGALMIILALF